MPDVSERVRPRSWIRWYIPITVFLSSSVVLMGKCAYTRRILYWNPSRTPVIMLLMWLMIDLMVACRLLTPYHSATCTFPSSRYRSTDACLNSFTSVPRGPFTVTTRDLTATSTSAGMSRLMALQIARMAAPVGPRTAATPPGTAAPLRPARACPEAGGGRHAAESVVPSAGAGAGRGGAGRGGGHAAAVPPCVVEGGAGSRPSRAWVP